MILTCSIALLFDRHLCNRAAELPVEFHSDKTFVAKNIAASKRDLGQYVLSLSE